MRTLKKYWAVLMLTCLAFGLASTEKAMAHGGTGVSFQTFYDELTPYGRWIDYPGHGYVWSPNVEAGFQPYATRGHWVMTEYGNTWVSDYAWGWAPFHYGRWLWDDYYGWVWVPGTEWGPAWVSWRTGADYYGWAPLGPGVHINININIPVAHWVFVPRRHIMSRRVYNYCVPRPTVVKVYHNTTIINNYYNYDNRTYVYGPRTQEIEQHTRSRVPVHRVNQDSRPGRAVVDKGTVRMYRPNVTAQRNEAPARVVSRDNVTRPDRDGSLNSERTDRSSFSETRSIPERITRTEDNRKSAAERLSESRRFPGSEGNAAGVSRPAIERSPEEQLNQRRERLPEGRTGRQETDVLQPREPVRDRAVSAPVERDRTSAAPERVVRERTTRTEAPYNRAEVPFERPAATAAPARRTMPQPDRTPYNPGVRQERQEQPASRPVQRPDAGTGIPQRARSQSQPAAPARVIPESRQVQPQRPQRQESSGSISERRTRSSF